MSKSVSLTVIALAGLSPCNLAQESTEAARDLSRMVDEFVDPLLEDGVLSGALLVVRDDKVVTRRFWGMADYEHRVPITAKTRFCIASISKPMTQILTRQLVDEGKLDMRSTISKWFPQFPRGDEITVQMLHDHTAGIPHRVTTPRDETVPISAAEMVARAAKAELLFEPGTGENYSSAGYSILARILELVSEQPYGVLLQEKICRPAGMTRTLHTNHTRVLEDRARSYFVGASGPENAPLKDVSFLVGAGSAWSTVDDLEKMCVALLRGKLLNEASTKRFTPTRDRSWNGLTNGFASYVQYLPDINTRVIFTGNMQSSRRYLRDAIPKMLRGQPYDKPARLPKAITVGWRKLETYEGVYRVPNRVDLDVRVRDSVLRCQGRVMIPTGEDRFYYPDRDAHIRFVYDDTGKVRAMEWKEGRQTWPLAKISELR